jgi:glucosylceramidase
MVGGAAGQATGGAPATGGVTSAGGLGGTVGDGGSGGQWSATGGQPAGGRSGTGGVPAPASLLVTSAPGSYWQAGTFTETTSGSAAVTVNDSVAAQPWEGFGGTFNEIGWSLLTSKAMQDQAMALLFSSSDGANLAWGLIPIGADDYALSRYTLDDTGPDVAPAGNNRPAADATLANFSLERDSQQLIPYIHAAQAVKPDLRFWAMPWTPPVWMKSGYDKFSSASSSAAAVKPSYYDGGNMLGDLSTLTAYAAYFSKFVEGYRDQGIRIELVAPQEDPTFDENYPSCIWDAGTYTAFIGQYLGPAMKALDVSVMLGGFANYSGSLSDDFALAAAALADPTATSFVSVAGVEWDALDRVNAGNPIGNLPTWVTTHKGGNYPFCGAANPPYCPGAYNPNQAPNDQAYAVESWGYIRNAITKGRVTAYTAWNMVLDKTGLGIDTSRDWKQDALLVADGGQVTATPAYYVFRHVSQYVVPGATVVGTTGGDAIAFKNPDGSLVAVVYNSGAADSAFIVAIAGKKLQFAMPANGWATIKYTP